MLGRLYSLSCSNALRYTQVKSFGTGRALGFYRLSCNTALLQVEECTASTTQLGLEQWQC